MKRIKIHWLALAALILLSGCGGAPEAASSAASTTEPETFGITSAAEMTQAASAADQPAPDQTQAQVTEEDTTVQAPDSVPSVDLTQAAIKAAACAVYFDGIDYQPMDPVYFWRAVCYLAGEVGTSDPAITEEDGFLVVAAEDLPRFVERLFGPYTEQYPSLGEENPFARWEVRDGAEFYVITRRDLDNLSVEQGEPERTESGTILREVVLLEDGTEVMRFQAELTETENDTASLLDLQRK